MRIKRVFLKIITGFWAIPVVLFIRAIRPFFYIKFLQIRSNRIGSFVFDSVYQIILKLRQKKNFYSLLCFEEPTSNDYWAKFIKRQKAINQWSWYLYYWNKKIPRGDKHIERSYLTPLSRDLIGLFEKSRLNLNFQSKENIKGYNEGLWWIQNLSTMMPIYLLNDMENKNVADLCAAPGGKSFQLITKQAKVTAFD